MTSEGELELLLRISAGQERLIRPTQCGIKYAPHFTRGKLLQD